MSARMGEAKTEIVRVRVTKSLRERCAGSKNAGGWAGRAESDFYGYLVELGLIRYEQSILPIEQGDDLRRVKPIPEGRVG